MKAWSYLSSILLLLAHTPASALSCFYINSYHKGYEWGDRIQEQFNNEMNTVCNISYHYLNAKKITNSSQLKSKGVEIANLIALSQPDIVIAADDAASEYVVNPYLRNGRTPIVYVGVNWDPRPFGYPMNNATGMTEVWPIQQALNTTKTVVSSLKNISLISSNNPLELRDEEAIKKVTNKNNITLTSYFVNTFDEWKKAIEAAQDSDAIKLGTIQGIKDWNKAEAVEWIKKHNQRFTFSNQDFMLPYSMYSISKSPEEFGHWAAELSKAIFNGDQPWQIPIIPNRVFIPRYNPELLSLTQYKLPDSVIRQAIAFKSNKEAP
jgi:ABC-type uncharacterized transport system substrate-binding protein